MAYLWVVKVKRNDLNTEEVVRVVTSRFDGEVEVKEVVEYDVDWRNEIDEHACQFALC